MRFADEVAALHPINSARFLGPFDSLELAVENRSQGWCRAFVGWVYGPRIAYMLVYNPHNKLCDEMCTLTYVRRIDIVCQRERMGELSECTDRLRRCLPNCVIEIIPIEMPRGEE